MRQGFIFKRISWIVIFLLGSLAGVFGTMEWQKEYPITMRSSEIRNTNVDYGLTNPLLECAELPESISIGQRVDLQVQVEERIALAKKVGFLTNGAVYFRDLNNGPWFGVNEDFKFYPASLLKVPLAVSFYFRAEEEPGILTAQVEYNGGDENVEASQAFGSSARLLKGKIYNATELITFMLQESSNEAALLLVQIMGADRILTVYQDFGISSPTLGEDYQIDVHTYASFFRILFNATYIDRVASEQLLGIMTKSAFKEGIVAGVPADVRVAHKFGTREVNSLGVNQLHDCGIVYAPNNPYVLCVMTQGKDFTKLADFIREVSSLVYSEIEK